MIEKKIPDKELDTYRSDSNSTALPTKLRALVI